MVAILHQVLVVDGDAVSATVIKATLEPQCSVTISSSGTQALGYLQSCKNLPDIILLEMKLPDTNGLDLLKLIKATPEIQHIPVIFVCKLENVALQVDGYTQGAEAFIPKPIIAPLLKRIVAHHFHLLDVEREAKYYADLIAQIKGITALFPLPLAESTIEK